MDRELIREWNKIFNYVYDEQPDNIDLAKVLKLNNTIKSHVFEKKEHLIIRLFKKLFMEDIQPKKKFWEDKD